MTRGQLVNAILRREEAWKNEGWRTLMGYRLLQAAQEVKEVKSK